MRPWNKVYTPFFLWLLILSSSLFSYHRDVEKILFSGTDSQNTFFASSAILEKALSSLKSKSFDKIELRVVQLMVQKKLPHLNFTIESVRNIYALVSYIQENKKDLFSGVNSLYFYSSREIPLDLQIYDDGTAYIHFGGNDPKKAKGGYKHFSRSINLKDKKLYANLVLDASNPKNLQKLAHELDVMRHMKLSSSALTFEHFSLFQGALGKKKATIQTKLFSSDLKGMFENKLSLKSKLLLMLKSAKSLKRLHTKGYVHRDIKARNFFVEEKNNGKYGVIIADYGFAEAYKIFSQRNSLMGTKGYIDPYLCKLRVQKPDHLIRFHHKKSSDIFSLGMMFYDFLMDQIEAKERNYQINLHAMRKWEGPLPYEAYVSLIEKELDKIEDTSSDVKGKIPSFLKKTIFKMISPSQKDRPSLRRVISDLKKALKKIKN